MLYSVLPMGYLINRIIYIVDYRSHIDNATKFLDTPLVLKEHYRLRPQGVVQSIQMPSSHSSRTNVIQSSGELRQDTHIPRSQSPSDILLESLIAVPQHAHCQVIMSLLI